MSASALARALIARADGMRAAEAGVDLLIAHGQFLGPVRLAGGRVSLPASGGSRAVTIRAWLLTPGEPAQKRPRFRTCRSSSS
jgi:hypothetical protein